jgi:UDP-glucose 4-epimerase
MVRYLILGGTGFIGKNLIKKLLEVENNQIISLSQRINSELISGAKIFSSRVTFHKGNFSSSELDFNELTKGIEVIVHLISTTNPSNGNQNMLAEVGDNVLPTIRLLESCVLNSVKKVVFISSGGTVYGRTDPVPLTEDCRTNPICSYGIQKLTIEKYLALFHHLYGLNYNVIRLSNPYGPHQNPGSGVGAVTTFTYNGVLGKPIHIYGDGTVVRDYIYIDDAIKGIHNIMHYNGKHRIFNLGSGRGHSILEIIAIIENVLNEKFDVHFDQARGIDVPYNVLDVSRYRSVFRNDQFVPISIGIEKLKDYILNRN